MKQIKYLSPGRYDCPICGNKNTLSIKREGVALLFYCFHASCHIKGKIEDDNAKIDAISAYFNIYNNDGICNNNQNPKNNKDLLFIRKNSSCTDYLRSFDISCMDLDYLKYDPKQDRLVFPLDYKGKNYGHVGRLLNMADNTSPKWLVYSRLLGCPFFSNRKQKTEKLLLVEDCISALRTRDIIDSCAILGTSINQNTIPYLLDYNKLYLALDDDATGKALEIQKQLSLYRETHIIPLTKDLKYFTNQELKEFKEKWLKD